MNTVGQLITSVVNQIFAGGQPENLVEGHRQIVLEALSEIQKDVICEQDRNANVIRFCNTYFKCGMTIVEAPRGVILRVYTIANDDWCDPVFYDQKTKAEVECYDLSCRTFDTPENTGLPVLPLGFKKAEATTDSTQGRARCGWWAVADGNIYLAPWIQSNEKVVIEWRGIKEASNWSDDDPVSDSLLFRKAVKLYLQYGHERDYGDMGRALTFHNHQKTGTYDEVVSDMIVECQERTRVRLNDTCHKRPTWAQVEDDAVPA